jgi:hypothetical protein
MDKRSTTITAAAALMVACVGVNHPNSMPIGDPSSTRAAIDDLNIIDNVQYFLGGKRYCFYREGWNGPGWYVCGYNNRSGSGWGGPAGWRGWVVGGGGGSGGGGGGSGGGVGGGGGMGGGGGVVRGGGHRGGSGGNHGTGAQASHSPKFPGRGGGGMRGPGPGHRPHGPGMGGQHRGGGHGGHGRRR